MADTNFRCMKCKKLRPRIVGATRICFRCQLFGVLLMQAFKNIVKQDDMLEFEASMREWYLHDAT